MNPTPYSNPPPTEGAIPDAPPPNSVSVQVAYAAQTPWVSYTIMAITVLVYLAQMGTQVFYGVDYPAAYGVKYAPLILENGQWWRLFTPLLLHGSIIHIAFNMYALNLIGTELEKHYGHGRYLMLYLGAGFAGNVLSMLLTPAPSLGASTALFGMLGAQGIFIYLNRGWMGSRSRRALGSIVQILVINLLIGLAPGLDNWGHLGGLIGGAIFAWFAGPVLALEGIYPDYRLADKRSLQQAWLAIAGVFLLFAALAFSAYFVDFWPGV